MTATIPTEFQGVWKRVALDLDGEQIDDDTECFWAQGAHRFVDVRVSPTDPMGATVFAGVTSRSPGTLTWHHDFDVGPDLPATTEPFVDTATVALDGDRLIERGAIDIGGSALPYREIWQRVTVLGQTSQTSIIEHDQRVTAIAVTAGEWMVLAHAHADVERSGGWILRAAPGGNTRQWSVVHGTCPEPIPLPDSDRDVRWPWRHHT